MKKRLNKRRLIVTLSAATMGVMLFVGGVAGYKNISNTQVSKVEKKSGKYAAGNSEKAKFQKPKRS
jgi:predicted negative regulator of RcsB-dependent stress response